MTCSTRTLRVALVALRTLHTVVLISHRFRVEIFILTMSLRDEKRLLYHADGVTSTKDATVSQVLVEMSHKVSKRSCLVHNPPQQPIPGALKWLVGSPQGK